MSHRTDAQQSLAFRPAERNPARPRIDPARVPPSSRELQHRRERDWNAMMGIDPTEMHLS